MVQWNAASQTNIQLVKRKNESKECSSGGDDNAFSLCANYFLHLKTAKPT